MYFMSFRINSSTYSQGKTFTRADHEDGSSKLAHLTCKQISVERCDLGEGWPDLCRGQHACSYSTMAGIHSDWLVPIMTLLNITPELKPMLHEV